MTTEDLAGILNELEQLRRSSDVSHRIWLCQQAISLVSRTERPRLWAALHVELGNVLAQSPVGDQAENLEQAIVSYLQALDVMTQANMPVEWATVINNLATVYSDRIRGARTDNIERAISLYQQALQVRTREALPDDWAQTMDNLASAYCDRIAGNRADNLEQAIAIYKEVLQIRTREANPFDWAQTMNNLGTAYTDRIRGDRAENLERAIAAYIQALQVRTPEAMPFDWAQTLDNLANALSDRVRGSRAENLERAIAAYHQTLQVVTRETMPVNWAQTMNNLASAYMDRIRGDRAKNMELAIRAYQDALEVWSEETSPVAWARVMNNLSNAYLNRISGDRADNLERAIIGYQQALRVRTQAATPVEWATSNSNLANAYGIRIRGDQPRDIEKALVAHSNALQVMTRDAMPAEHVHTQRALGGLCFSDQRWLMTQDAFLSALNASNDLYSTAATPEARRTVLAQVQSLPSRLAYACCRQSAENKVYLRNVVLQLERNRARWLAESLALGSDRPEDTPDSDWGTFVEHRERVQALQAEAELPDRTPGKRAFTELSPLLSAAREDLRAAIAAVQRHAPDFMPEPNFTQVQAAAPLVYVLATEHGGLALLVPVAGEPQPIWLHGLTTAWLDSQLVEHSGEDITGGYMPAVILDPLRLSPVLPPLLAELGDKLAPLAEALQTIDAPHGVTIIASGALGVLPLHAAHVGDGRTLQDVVPIRYAPSAVAMQAKATHPAGAAGSPLLALGNPLADTHPALFTDWLAEEAGRLLHGAPPLLHGRATAAALQAALAPQPPQHLLFGCHGSFDPVDPLASGLELADGTLTLRRLLSEQSLDGVDLAVLCACQTAIADFNQVPDEALGLPAAFLQAGVRRVIGTLWPVDALATVLLLHRFYELLATGTPALDALRLATAWLRMLPQAEALALWPELCARLPLHRLGMDRVRAGIEARLHSADLPFAAPEYWAAFTYTGPA